jgi:hypothetical protein
MGYGSALVEIPFGSELIQETANITAFMAPVQEGHLSMLFCAEGKVPILAQLIFPALLAPAPPGVSLNTKLPLVPTLPQAPDAVVAQLNSTIGPLNLTYHERLHGKTIPYKPRGIILPKTCPRGGFPFTANLSFQDNTKTSATTRVPCHHRTYRGIHAMRS